MRTKTLLLTAALCAAGIITSIAADSVYSVNVVGYVTKAMNGGFNLVCNPLDGTNMTGEAIQSQLPDSVVVYKLKADASGYLFYTWYLNDPNDPSQGGLWVPTVPTLPLGVAFYVFNPGSAFNLTWVGEVKQGLWANTVPAGFSFQASQVPQSNDVQTLGLGPKDTDVVYKLKPDGSGFNFFTWYLNDPNDPSQGGVWVPNTPGIDVGEGFIYYSVGGATFTRDFKVN